MPFAEMLRPKGLIRESFTTTKRRALTTALDVNWLCFAQKKSTSREVDGQVIGPPTMSPVWSTKTISHILWCE